MSRTVVLRGRRREKWSERSFPYHSTYVVCAGVGLLWKPPPHPYIPYTKVAMTTGPLASHPPGCRWTRFIVHVRAFAECLCLCLCLCMCAAQAAVQATLSRTYYVPMGTASCCPVCSCHGDCITLPAGSNYGGEMRVKEG